MGGGQPEVQRHDAGLQAEAEQREQEDGARHARPARDGRERLELERAGRRTTSRPNSANRASVADVGGDEVDPAGLPHLGALVLGGDQQERRERHDLPGEQEGHAVGGEHDSGERRDQDAEAQAQLAAVVGVLGLSPVALAVERAGGTERRTRAPGRRRPAGRAADAARARGAPPPDVGVSLEPRPSTTSATSTPRPAPAISSSAREPLSELQTDSRTRAPALRSAPPAGPRRGSGPGRSFAPAGREWRWLLPSDQPRDGCAAGSARVATTAASAACSAA